jgi:hypothetical protein
MPLKSYFRESIYFFYPTTDVSNSDIDSLLDQSVEFDRLRAICHQYQNHSFYLKYLSELRKVSPYPKADITIDERIGVEYKKCFTLKILLEAKESKNNLSERVYLIINFSILVPYFTIDVVKQTYLLGSLISSAEIIPEVDYPEYFKFYRTYINKSGIQEFPKEYYEEKLPEIVFPDIENGNFTYFNAFYLSSFDDVTGF